MRLSPEIRSFIRENAQADPETLALQRNRYPDLPMSFIAQQVKSRQRVKEKLPTWCADDAIIFPSRLSLEQCSSERAAEYKAGLLKGQAAADLTGGFGVDAWAFSRNFDKVFHVERDPELSKIVRENARVLKCDAVVEAVADDGIEWLRRFHSPLDLIYLDPARRDDRQFKVSALEECEPNLLNLWDELLMRAKQVAVKLSPGLDVDYLVSTLSGILEIHVLSLQNECKEIFCLAEAGFEDEARIICVNEGKDGVWQRFEFRRSEEKRLSGQYKPYSRYLYEPNASIMKAGAFKTLAERLGLPLIHPRTRFYTSDSPIKNFPGRGFEILAEGELRSKSVKNLFPEGRANAMARNVGMTTDALKKKLALRDGGELFAIALTDTTSRRRLLKCRRIS